MNEEKILFNNLEEHIDYLLVNRDKREYVFWEEITKVKTSYLLHGTSKEGIKHILKAGVIESGQHDPSGCDYNKVFLTSLFSRASNYGMMKNLHRNIDLIDRFLGLTDEYFVLEIDTSGYDTYKCEPNDYFVWGKISIDSIKKVYVCKKGEIITITTIWGLDEWLK